LWGILIFFISMVFSLTLLECVFLISSNSYQKQKDKNTRCWHSARAKTSPSWRGKPINNSSYRDSNWRTPRPWPLTCYATPIPRHQPSSFVNAKIIIVTAPSLSWLLLHLYHCCTEVFIIIFHDCDDTLMYVEILSLHL